MRGRPMRGCAVRGTMRGTAMRRRAALCVHGLWLHLLRLRGTLLEVLHYYGLGLRLLTATDGNRLLLREPRACQMGWQACAVLACCDQLNERVSGLACVNDRVRVLTS
jgi:hypothetical protein